MTPLPRHHESELLDFFNACKIVQELPPDVEKWDRTIFAITQFCVRHPDVAAFRAYLALKQLTKHQAVSSSALDR